jgi:hypothetical protein
VKFILSLFILFLTLELIGYIGTHILHHQITILRNQNYSQKEINKYKRIYSFERGWIASKSRSNNNWDSDIFCYGDSFTYGDDVEQDQTWSYFLENSLNKSVNNLGVNGYGLDQIYYSLKADISKINNKIIIISFISNDIRRSVSVYRKFLSPLSQNPLTKPRVIYDKDKKMLIKIANPIKSIRDVSKIKKSSFYLNIVEQDFWAKQIPPFQASFPFSRLLVHPSLLNELKYIFLNKESLWEKRSNNWFFKQGEAQDIFSSLLKSMEKLSKDHGNQIIFNYLPKQSEVDKVSETIVPLNNFLEICRKNNFICTSPLLSKNIKLNKDLDFSKRLHYNAKGNKKVAQYLSSKLNTLTKND